MKKFLDNIEAIECLKQVKHILLNNNSWLESTHDPITQSFDKAIKSLEEKENKINNMEKGLVIISYPGIGKTSFAGKDNCIVLESGHFWVGDRKDEDWAIVYAKLALDLASQGYTVFVNSQKEVREAFKTLQIPENVGKIVIFCPDHRYKNEWIEKVENRFKTSRRNKDYKSWQRVLNHFDEDIFDLINDNDFPVYQPAYLDYDLWNYIHKMRNDWCK